MQIVLTIVILMGAVGYAAWRFYDTFREGGDPCKDCEFKKNCTKNCQKNPHQTCHCK